MVTTSHRTENPDDAVAAKSPKTPKTPRKEPPTLQRIRTELNLEKWPIWRPAKSKTHPKERTIRREVSLPNGSKLFAEVEIGFTNKGALDTEDQKTLYALIRHWEAKGRPTEKTFYSLRGLTAILEKKWGTNVIDSTTESLLRLRTTPFIWRNSYYDSTKNETIREIDTFTILSELRIMQRERDGYITREGGYFRFNDFILRNLLNNHTKPLLFSAVMKFKSEIAQLLYTYLDLILADKEHYERKTQDLFFEDLGLDAKEYVKTSSRIRRLENALQELQGTRLTTGVLSTATLERTKDEKDYKVVFCKRPWSLPFTGDTSLREKQEEGRAQHSPPTQNSLRQAVALVNYFYQRFHNIKNTTPQSKELDQAVDLITHHGVDRARYLVDYSYAVAPETHYHPQTFGGILQYTARALAEYQKSQAQKQTREAIANCPLCNPTGLIIFEDVEGNSFAWQCPHDPRAVKDLERQKKVKRV